MGAFVRALSLMFDQPAENVGPVNRLSPHLLVHNLSTVGDDVGTIWEMPVHSPNGIVHVVDHHSRGNVQFITCFPGEYPALLHRLRLLDVFKLHLPGMCLALVKDDEHDLRIKLVPDLLDVDGPPTKWRSRVGAKLDDDRLVGVRLAECELFTLQRLQGEIGRGFSH